MRFFTTPTQRPWVIVMLLAGCGSPEGATESYHTRASVTACPPPTVKNGGLCVLDQDVVLDKTLALESFTHLDCNGHKMSPTTSGAPGRRSVPELAILMNQTTGAKLQNCILDGFDFGVAIINNKTPESASQDPGAMAGLRNKILSNTINVRIRGVVLLNSDNNQIGGNSITWTSGSGGGVLSSRDSDQNKITNNTLTGSAAPIETPPPRTFPSGLPIGAGFLLPNSGIVFGDQSGRPSALIVMSIEGSLVQFPSVQGARSDGNLIEGNTVTIPFVPSSFTDGHRGISVLQRVTNTIIRGNTVSGGVAGISAQGNLNRSLIFPSTCSEDSTRYCSTTGVNDECLLAPSAGTCRVTCQLDSSRECTTDADCLAGACGIGPRCSGDFSTPCATNADCPPNMGQCVREIAGTLPKPDSGLSRDTLIEKNTLNGPFFRGAIGGGASEGLIVQDNTINGNNGTGAIGVFMATTLVETATVRRNVITGTRIGIYMNREVEFGFAPTFFGAQVYLNDITGCTERAVETDGYFLFGTPQGPYAFPSELSVLGRGNYWGHTCEEGGFLHGDSPNPSLVKDSHPYGAPVAKSATPPASCF